MQKRIIVLYTGWYMFLLVCKKPTFWNISPGKWIIGTLKSWITTCWKCSFLADLFPSSWDQPISPPSKQGNREWRSNKLMWLHCTKVTGQCGWTEIFQTTLGSLGAPFLLKLKAFACVTPTDSSASPGCAQSSFQLFSPADHTCWTLKHRN